MNLTRKLRHPTRKQDPFYFLAHNYYLSKRFTLRQRVDVAMRHHEYELQTYTVDYAKDVYRSEGALLWRQYFGDLCFKIVLTASLDNRHEGDLTVILYADDVDLCQISFCYLTADVFERPPCMTMLISRNQTHRTSARDLFDRCFGQNSPQLFCLSAICGIAMANEFKTILAIKHDAQIAYEARYDSNFRNSYTGLWEKFDAVELDQHVYEMDIPLTLRPVELVSRSHRRRARTRRGHWDEIVHSVVESMARYRAFPHPGLTVATASRGGGAFSDGQSSPGAMSLASPA
jgi:uncharacterized protein VirK/YbjX